MAKVYNSLGQIGSSSTITSQDNKELFKYISIESDAPELLHSEVLTLVNSTPQYVVNEYQSVWFIILQFATTGDLESDDLPPKKYVYKVANVGKGTYGLAGTPLLSDDLKLITVSNILVEDIEVLPNTQVINFGHIGITEVWNYLNILDPSISLQSQTIGYRLFKTLNADYLFLGGAGIYGLNNLQTTEADFQELSKTSNLTLQPLATTGISVQNSLGQFQFSITEYVKFKGVTFNSVTKEIQINPLVGGAIFVSDTIGNDATAIIENRSMPFKTLNAAIDAFWANPQMNYIEILDNATYTTDRAFNNGGVRDFELRSDKKPTVTVTTTGTYGGLESGGILQNITFNMPRGTLNLAPTSDTRFGVNPNRRPIVTINVNIFTVNSFWKYGVAREFYLKANNTIISGSTGLVGGTNSIVTEIISKTITFIGVGSLVAGNGGNRLVIDFDNIIHDNTFTLFQTGSVNTVINHGGISGTYAGANFSYTISPSGRIDINYKSGFSITTNLSLNFFNSSNVNLTITGIADYINSDSFIIGNNHLTSPIVFLNANITCKRFVSGRSVRTYKFINSIVKITGTAFAELTPSSIDGDGYTPIPPVAGSFNTPTFIFEGTNYILCTTNNLNLITYSNVLTNIPSVDLSKGILYTNGKFDRATINIIENPLNQYYDTTQRQLVIVNEKEEIVNKVLDPTKIYMLDGLLVTLFAGEYIYVNDSITIAGYGFNTSGLSKNVPGEGILKSTVGGDLVLKDLVLSSGVGTVFDIEDVDGTHAIEINDVNFDGSSSLGKIRGYRQITAQTIGMYAVKDGVQLSGAMNGVSISKLHVRNFGTTGVPATIFKKDTDTTFSGRFIADANIDFKTGGSFSDFTSSNFSGAKRFKINGTEITRNNVVDDTQNYTNTITAFDLVSDWSGNNGIKNSPINPYGIRTSNMLQYASDALATAGGIPVGEVYKRPDGLFKINNGSEPIFTRFRYIDNVITSPITGTTSETVIYTFPIPGNTLSINDSINLKALFVKTGTAGAASIRVYVGNTAGATTTALAIYTTSSTQSPFERTHVVRAGNVLEGLQHNFTSLNDLSNSNLTLSSRTFDNTITQHITITIQLAVGTDSVAMHRLALIKQ